MARPRLAVVTHYSEKGEHFSEMLSSLASAMPDYAEHFLIHCPNSADFVKARWESRLLGDHFVFVDSDDLVINDSIRMCMAVFDDRQELGAVFTKQELIDVNGNPLRSRNPINDPHYHHLITNVQAMHHLTILRSGAIHEGVLKAVLETGLPSPDWAMKASAALTHGAQLVPISGYKWRQHRGSQSKNPVFVQQFNRSVSPVRKFLSSIQRVRGPIPQSFPKHQP